MSRTGRTLVVLFALSACQNEPRGEGSASGSSPSETPASASSTAEPSASGVPAPLEADCTSRSPACDGAERWLHAWAGPGDVRVTAILHGEKTGHWAAAIYQQSVVVPDLPQLSGDDTITPPVNPFDAHDSLVARVDDAGHATHVIKLHGPGDQIAHELARDATGNVYVVGSFGSGYDKGAPRLDVDGRTMTSEQRFFRPTGFVLALDEKGAPKWFDATPGFESPVTFDNVAVSGETVWVSGYSSDESEFQTTFVRALGLDGKERFRWAMDQARVRHARQGYVRLRDIVADRKGGAILVGEYRGALERAGTPLLPAGSPAFAIGLSSNGDVQWAKQLECGAPQHGGLDDKGRLWLTTDAGELVALDENRAVRFTRRFSKRAMGQRATYVNWKAEHFFTEGWANGALLDVDPAGNVTVLTGFSSSFQYEDTTTRGAHKLDSMLLKVDPEGRLLWKRLVSGDGQLPHALAVDETGSAWLGGIQVERADGFLARHAR